MEKKDVKSLFILIIVTASVYVLATILKIQDTFSSTAVYYFPDAIMDYIQLLIQLFLFVIVILQAKQTQFIMSNDMKKFNAEHSADLVAVSIEKNMGFSIYNQGSKLATNIVLTVPKVNEWMNVYEKLKENGMVIRLNIHFENIRKTLLPTEKFDITFNNYNSFFGQGSISPEIADLLVQLANALFEVDLTYLDGSIDNNLINKRLKIDITNRVHSSTYPL